MNSTDTWSMGFTYYTLHITGRVNRRYSINLDTVFLTQQVYLTGIRSLIPAGLGIFCCYFFWCWPARLACQPLQSGTMQYTIVDDNVEAVPIYRCSGKAQQPTPCCKNHGLHMEPVPTWTESRCKQQTQSLVVPAQGSLAITSKIQGTQKCT